MHHKNISQSFLFLTHILFQGEYGNNNNIINLILSYHKIRPILPFHDESLDWIGLEAGEKQFMNHKHYPNFALQLF